MEGPNGRPTVARGPEPLSKVTGRDPVVISKVRIRVDVLKDPKTRQKNSERVAAAVAGVRACGDSDSSCPFKCLSLMQQAPVP